jgi:hypothetical protein
MTTPNPLLFLVLSVAFLTGCATRGPMHLYSAGDGALPIHDQGLETGTDNALGGFLQPGDRVIGLGYEHNTDYIWVRLAPGNRLLTIKRGIQELWYDYSLPDAFLLPPESTGDLAVRSFNRMVYAVMSEPGTIGKVTRYGEVLETFRPDDHSAEIGGLAWDQVNDLLLVLYSATGEVAAYAKETQVVSRVQLDAAINAMTLAYDSNRARFYVPLAEPGWVGEFDAEGQLLARLPWPKGMTAMDAGQRSLIRLF